MPESIEESNNEDEAEKEIFDEDNIVMHCALRGNIDRMKLAFDNNDDPQHESALGKINTRNNVGKTPLEVACMLNKETVVQELIKRGVDINDKSASEYTPLHIAACWGSRQCLEVLVENGAKLNVRNVHNETPRMIAVRYNKLDCIEFLDWAAAKRTLADFILELRELISDPEKLQGVKLTKEEKTSTIAACNEKQEWIESTPEATITDFLSKKEELETQAESVLAKANTPLPNTGSTGKK